MLVLLRSNGARKKVEIDLLRGLTNHLQMTQTIIYDASLFWNLISFQLATLINVWC
jgi:hypothetical protein